MPPFTLCVFPAKHFRPFFPRLAPLFLLALLALAGCASVTPGASYPKSVSTAYGDPAGTWLGHQFAPGGIEHPGLSGLRLVPVGVDGFLLRAQLIARAEKTLDLQYFIFTSDETGQLLSEAILQAADRGVRVRLLIDDIINTGNNARIEVLDAHPNIEVRVYNPLAYRGDMKALRWADMIVHHSRLDYRMHNKLMIADNAVGLVGGRNVGDDYFQIDPDGQVGDYEVFTVGPVVENLSACFDEFWKAPSAIPVAALSTGPVAPQALLEYRQSMALHREEKREDGSDYASRMESGQPLGRVIDGRLPLVWAVATLWYDTPEKRDVESGARPGHLMRADIFAAAAAAQSEVLVIAAYFIPGADGMVFFEELHQRSIKASLLTNSMESNTADVGTAGYLHYRHALLANDVTLYEIRAQPGSIRGTGQSAKMSSFGNYGLHTKLFVFDRQRIFIGTMNFDQRSLHINTEMGLMIESPELARQGVNLFEGLTGPTNSYRVLLGPAEPMVNNRPPPPRHLVWQTEVNGRLVQYDFDPARTPWQRLKVNLLTLLPLDSEL